MATRSKAPVAASGRRAGKTTAQKEEIAQANAKGQTVEVRGPGGSTIHEPGKAPRKVARKAPADKPQAKGAPAAKKPARKADKAPSNGKVAADGKLLPKAPDTVATPEVKRPVGRPSVYRPEFCDALIAFFRIEVERTEAVVVPDPSSEGGTKTEMVKVLNTFPTLERFADSIDVTRQTLYDWAHATVDTPDGPTLRHPEFSYAYARARDLQAALLQEGGMAGAYESRFATLATKNLIGWRDQIEQVVDQTITAVNTTDLDAIYEKARERSKQAEEEAKARAAAAGVEGMENGGVGA
ncbi:hypothetical protein LA345_38780 (plasmid) [Burkholderia vietnamiensis]|uniref:Terminase small subunit n=1 Tax=Burkholderia vietnamiensis (strain G4 / LMG 22486) TaxID=269482 RepID=A4JWB8_BURVG|nr:hypothetical protein Bcep1808_7701 [Burkholderia vietnamiensis G4]MCB4349744.1 hypothetical protein [Burkholderia vietnamiensis]